MLRHVVDVADDLPALAEDGLLLELEELRVAVDPRRQADRVVVGRGNDVDRTSTHGRAPASPLIVQPYSSAFRARSRAGAGRYRSPPGGGDPRWPDSSTPKFRRAPPTVRREALIEATLACLRKYGHEGLSVRRIGAEAGVSPGLITHHFPSVSALIAAAYETLSMSLLQSIEQHARAVDASPRERLRRFLRGIVRARAARSRPVQHLAGLLEHDLARSPRCGRCTTAPTPPIGPRSNPSSASCTGPRAYRDSGCVRRRSPSQRCSMDCGSRPASIRAPSGRPRPSRSARIGRARCAKALSRACWSRPDH